MTARRITAAAFATVYALLFSLMQANVVPPHWHNLADWGLGAIMIVSATLLPAIFGEATVQALPATVDKIAKVAVVLALLLPAVAHAEPWSALMPGIALNPAPAPVDDPGAIAQNAPQIGTPAAVVPPPSTPDVPPAAATNPAIPLDCARCAKQVAGVVAPGKPWPVWATVAIVVVSGAMATLQALHDTGVLK